MPKIRRVITGHNAAGRSVILFDDQAGDEGAPSVDLWGNYETPADLTGRGDVAAAGFAFNPPPGGAAFRYAEIAPESTVAHLDGEALRQSMRETFAAMGVSGAVVDQTRHWGMHRTNSIDYVVLLSGKVTLIMEEGEVDLEPFDVVVQRGANHGWSNRGEEPARLMAVMIDAVPVQGPSGTGEADRPGGPPPRARPRPSTG
jgi:quercetin dioxygenase-like cupin family protein